MRMQLQAHLQQSLPFNGQLAGTTVVVTLRPSNNQPGEFAYETESKALLKMLRSQTDLSGVILEQFEGGLRFTRQARIPSVTLKDDLLENIGYFTA